MKKLAQFFLKPSNLSVFVLLIPIVCLLYLVFRTPIPVSISGFPIYSENQEIEVIFSGTSRMRRAVDLNLVHDEIQGDGLYIDLAIPGQVLMLVLC